MYIRIFIKKSLLNVTSVNNLTFLFIVLHLITGEIRINLAIYVLSRQYYLQYLNQVFNLIIEPLKE